MIAVTTEEVREVTEQLEDLGTSNLRKSLLENAAERVVVTKVRTDVFFFTRGKKTRLPAERPPTTFSHSTGISRI